VRDRFLTVDETIDIGEIELVDVFRCTIDRDGIVLIDSSIVCVSDRRTTRAGGVIGSMTNGFLLIDCRIVNGVLVCGLETIESIYFHVCLDNERHSLEC
jgi:hypothetical protein